MSIFFSVSLKNFASQNTEQVLSVMQTDAVKGLSSDEASSRLKQ